MTYSQKKSWPESFCFIYAIRNNEVTLFVEAMNIFVKKPELKLDTSSNSLN